jgi:hypothetical protein
MQLDRTRIIFIVIIALAILGACVAFAYQRINSLINQTGEPTLEAGVTPVATTSTGSNQTTVNFDSPDPIYAAGVDLNDGLPTYVCGADAFGSYFTLQQMQVSGTDVANGFHLGIIPFDLNDDYAVTEEQRTALLANGDWDCLLTTLDSVSLTAPGTVTAIVDESAGADQLWGRGITTINDLRDKRIAFAEGSVGEYFMYYALSIARLNPRFDVTLVPQSTVADAVAAFNAGQADAVSAWEPDIYDAESSGGIPLLSSAQLRIVIDVIVTSNQSINARPTDVQNFHNAWFATLKAQVEDFDTAASQIAAWGNNDWSFVYPESATDDLQAWLGTVAQADLSDNRAVMRDPRPLVDRLNIARRVWAAAGQDVPNGDVADLVNPDFVGTAAQQGGLTTNADPVNDTFSIAANIDLTAVSSADDAATLAVLPCRDFQFLPESTELTLEARRQLDECVVPTMLQSIGLLLEVNGSSAWPQNDPPFTEQEIQEFAAARAQSVVDYLVSQGIDPARFIVTATLPPEERRNSDSATDQAQDRYVELTLITSGR